MGRYCPRTDVQQRCQDKAVFWHNKKAAVAKYLKALPVITAISEETLKMAHMTGSVDSEDSTVLKKMGHMAQTSISPGRKDNQPTSREHEAH